MMIHEIRPLADTERNRHSILYIELTYNMPDGMKRDTVHSEHTKVVNDSPR